MGMYLNPDNEVFKRITAADIYVDKSELLSVTNRMVNSANDYICMSRPRRFGKTVTGNMLSAYYSRGCDSSGIFSKLKIAYDESYEKHLNKYNVIQIDMNSEYQSIDNKDNLLSYLTCEIKKELVSEFENSDINEDDSLARSLLKVYAATGEIFIILIDEYDVLVREKVSQKLFDEYLSFLNSLFKSNTLRPAISLAYLTGILPIVRDKIQSKLNNFDEYTFLDADGFAEYVGFTAAEVKDLCNRFGMDFDECRRWYDGYFLNGYEIYNPESVVKSMTRHKFDYHWSKTSSYQVISDRLKADFKGTKEAVIRMLAGESIDVNVTSYLNTMDSFETADDIFTYMIHLGYLSYDEQSQTCRIPNNEVRKEWQNAVAVCEEYTATDEIIKDSKQLLEETLKGNETAVETALDASHIHVTSNRSYNNEDALQSAIYLAYIYALNQYTVIKEMTTGKGFADVAFIPFVPDKPAMIIELKHNKCAESAIDQIKKKRYFDSLSHYRGDLLFVGINYDEKEKVHKCRIERLVKQ